MSVKISRPTFILIAVLFVGVGIYLLHFFPFFSKKPDRPDILLIMTDQMRGDCLSILGHSAVDTPQLDKLAQQGILFRRAYATASSCRPARYSLLTGLYPQTSGVLGFKVKPIFTQPFPELLANAGYSTVLVGRNMHQAPESGTCGYQKEILGSTYISDDDYGKFFKKAVPQIGDIRTLVIKLGLCFNLLKAKPWPLPTELHPNEWIVAKALKIITENDSEKPLFLTTSFYAPHPPLFPPKLFFDQNAKQKMPSPAHGDWVDLTGITEKGDAQGTRVILKGQALHAAQCGYFGLIEHVDSLIPLLISSFKARSKKAGRPWVILFTSDHGEMLGDHCYCRKAEPYEGSANIPFIISGSPALKLKSGLRVMQPVCLEDIMPTLLTLAGEKSPSYIDGVNLLPIMRGQKQVIREWLHLEHAPVYYQTQAYHALTDGRYKYIWRPLNGREHLFDLYKDPKEERDLSNSLAYNATMDLWRTRLAKRLANRPEGFSKNGKLIPGRTYHSMNAGTLDADKK